MNIITRILIPTAFALVFAMPAMASEISGTFTTGPAQSDQNSSGQVGGTVGSSNSGSVGGTVAGGSATGGGGGGGGGGSILASGGGSANPLPGANASSGTIPSGGSIALSPTETITTTPAPTFFSPNIPASSGGAALTSGNDLADNTAGTPTDDSQYFGTNQAAAVAGSGVASSLWWAVALAALAIIALGWLGYRELA